MEKICGAEKIIERMIDGECETVDPGMWSCQCFKVHAKRASGAATVSPYDNLEGRQKEGRWPP